MSGLIGPWKKKTRCPHAPCTYTDCYQIRRHSCAISSNTQPSTYFYQQLLNCPCRNLTHTVVSTDGSTHTTLCTHRHLKSNKSLISMLFCLEKKPFQMDVAPRCYKWVAGWIGYLRAGVSKEHLAVLKSRERVITRAKCTVKLY